MYAETHIYLAKRYVESRVEAYFIQVGVYCFGRTVGNLLALGVEIAEIYSEPYR